MSKQFDTPSAVETAKADYVATGDPAALVRYEDALREWLFPPRVGSMAWHMQRNAKRRPPNEGGEPMPIAAAPRPLPPASGAAVPAIMAAE